MIPVTAFHVKIKHLESTGNLCHNDRTTILSIFCWGKKDFKRLPERTKNVTFVCQDDVKIILFKCWWGKNRFKKGHLGATDNSIVFILLGKKDLEKGHQGARDYAIITE